MKGTVWYLVAGTDAGLRTFRVGRVQSVERTGEPAERPKDFDLDATWREIVANVDAMRSPYKVEAFVDLDILPILRWMFEGQLVEADPQPTNCPRGRLAVTIGGHHVEQVAGQLAGFGDSATVTGPPEARTHLARIGAELMAAYGA
jgi:predicted DNA-binding transcriptional regulator YafY